MNDTEIIDLGQYSSYVNYYSLDTHHMILFLFTVPKQAVEKYYPDCHCTNDTTGQVCHKGGFKSPPYFQAVTSEFLQDITGQPEEKYYLNTNDIYRLHR